MPVFYTNLLYRLFPNDDLMKKFLRGNRVKGFTKLCWSMMYCINSDIPLKYYRWYSKSGHIKKAKKIAIARGQKDSVNAFKNHYNQDKYDYTGLLDLSCDEYDEYPSYIGGEKEVVEYINHNYVYPKIVLDNKISGIVKVSFYVEKDGSVTDAKVIGGDLLSLELYYRKMIGDGVDAEKVNVKRRALSALESAAVNVISEMPKWNPAKKDGAAVRAQMIMSFHYYDHRIDVTRE